MSKLMQLIKPVAAMAVVMAVAGVAHASSTMTYGEIAAPGVHYGAGNENGQFTIGTENGIELALRAKNYGGALIDGSSGVYHTDPGLSAIGLAAGKNRAVWNFDFSANTGANSLGNYVFMLGMDNDPSAATSYDYINIALYGDNHVLGNSVQNSQNIIFYPSGPLGPFNINTPGLYNFSLTAYAANDTARATALASTEILVAVPEPESMAMMGLGLLGLALARRRRAK